MHKDDIKIMRNIIQNSFMKFRVVQSFAKKYHVTGRNGSPNETGRIFEWYNSLAHVADKKILELGPGQTFDIIKLAQEHGAKQVAALDVIDYRTDSESFCDFKLYDGTMMPYNDADFDLVWSYDVLEHVRYPDITMAEIARILKPGGLFVARIDLVDHYYIGDSDPLKMFNCLKYTESLWNLMTSNRSGYVNRLRLSDWLGLWENYGLIIKTLETEEDQGVRAYYLKGKIPFLSRYSECDAVTHKITVVLQRPDGNDT